jgi:hypothetical protein
MSTYKGDYLLILAGGFFFLAKLEFYKQNLLKMLNLKIKANPLPPPHSGSRVVPSEQTDGGIEGWLDMKKPFISFLQCLANGPQI